MVVQEFFAVYLAQYPSHFTLTQAALADGGEGPSNVLIHTIGRWLLN